MAMPPSHQTAVGCRALTRHVYRPRGLGDKPAWGRAGRIGDERVCCHPERSDEGERPGVLFATQEHGRSAPTAQLLQHGQPVALDFGVAVAVRNAADGRKTRHRVGCAPDGRFIMIRALAREEREPARCLGEFFPELRQKTSGSATTSSAR